LRNLPLSPVTRPEIVKFMGTLALTQIVIIIMIRADVFMLGALANRETVADYTAAFQLAFCFPLVASALFNALLPAVSAMKTASQLAAYRRRLLQLYPAILVATAIGVLVLPFLVSLLFGERYTSAIPILRVLVLAFGIPIIVNPLSLIFYNINKPYYITAIHAGQLAIILPLNYVLIPRLGGLGPACSLLVIYTLSVAVTVAWTRRIIVIRRAKEEMNPESGTCATAPPRQP
jgi:O-antigen/teichoic acid export membrane protein